MPSKILLNDTAGSPFVLEGFPGELCILSYSMYHLECVLLFQGFSSSCKDKSHGITKKHQAIFLSAITSIVHLFLG
jgi:hypothetical protein